MTTTFTLGDDTLHEALKAVMQAHHEGLHAAGVQVGILIAYNPEGPAVKHHGTAARATIRVVSLKDRLTKGYDAELLIDQAELDLMRPDHLAALIDHELSHLTAVLKRGAFVRDDLGRPRLKLVPGDWDAGDGFREVVARHGDFAPEVDDLRRAQIIVEAAKADNKQ